MALKKATQLRGPIIFRPQRMGLQLDEAMAKAKEFPSVREMKKFIVKDWHEGWNGDELFTVKDIVIDEYTVNDERNGWEDTRYVCIKRLGEKIYSTPQCVGMCATVYPTLEKK